MSLSASLISKLHNSQILGNIFHTLDHCLQKELKDCKTVLDLGCGPSSPIKNCPWIKYSVGVEIFKPYLKESKKNKIHTKYLNKRIEEVNFKDKSFDSVIMIEVLEHLPKKVGYEILKKAERWAKKKIIVSTPNGFIKQPKVDNNIYQKHKSGWTIPEFKKLGFTVFGLAGLKILRKEKEEHDSMQAGDLLVSIRFRPKFFWFIIATLSQIVTFWVPRFSFGLFCVKKIK